MIDVKMLKKIGCLLLVVVSLTLSACGDAESTGHIKTQDGTAKLSLSSDGRYVIASTLHKKLFLFDIKNKTKKILSNDANQFSAYFVRGTHDFIWQDTQNTVYVQNVNGSVIEKFNLGVKTFGQVMSSDLKTYVGSDVKFNLYVRKNNNVQKINLHSDGYYGFKLLNLHISNDGKYLLSCGGDDNIMPKDAIPIEGPKTNYPADSVVLWRLNPVKPIFGYPGNTAKTYAAWSPGYKYLVSSDEDDNLNVWETMSGKHVYQAYDIYFGKYIRTGKGDNDYRFDKSVLHVQVPKDFVSPVVGARGADTISLNFLDKTHFIRIVNSITYAILYSVKDPSPLKYLKLSKKPFPSINDYTRNQSIDSSWQTHTFVTGHAIGDDITVYKYNPKKQTLNVVWISK